MWENIIPRIIHLPGLRGNPERTYPATAVAPNYPGTFEKYTASVVLKWMREEKDTLARLNEDLKRLGLTGGVTSELNDVQIEIHVRRCQCPANPLRGPSQRRGCWVGGFADLAGVGGSWRLDLLSSFMWSSLRPTCTHGQFMLARSRRRKGRARHWLATGQSCRRSAA